MEVWLVLWIQSRSAEARLLQWDGFRSDARSGILMSVKIDRSKCDTDCKLVKTVRHKSATGELFKPLS